MLNNLYARAAQPIARLQFVGHRTPSVVTSTYQVNQFARRVTGFFTMTTIDI
jgi:hypothetical protein